MRAWIISDLHISHESETLLQVPEADICICAGDVSNIVGMTVAFLRRRIEPLMPVVFVLGNHDCYGATIDGALEIARRSVEGSNVTVLENQAHITNGVRFIGATLWTDFLVPFGGSGPELPPDIRRRVSFDYCQKRLLDFHAIYGSVSYGGAGLIRPEEMIARHERSRAFIALELSKPFEGKSVVLTHHAPLARSRDARFDGSPSNGAFLSDLSDVIERVRPDIWVHGHVHRFHDYVVGSTRIISNPRGYSREPTGFHPGLVIEL